ncbi:MAG: hypothetical protein EOO51_00405 [Flavobacterium sp.]|nr:MAG: hypothetical protein EOO51_00405 [Flavobacterium sp.]
MAKFITGNALNLEIEKLLENGEKRIILISPFIKLHNRYEAALKSKLNKPNTEIIVVFGKNADALQKSMQYEDFKFFKNFPNIEIRHEKNLHAKYYANENTAVLTSMNLYSYSQDHNIEAGVSINVSSFTSVAANLLVNGITDKVDEDAWNYFSRVIKQSDLLYEKKPVFEKQYLGLKTNYKESIVKKDVLSAFFEKLNPPKTTNSQTIHLGFCIRTGVEIPFNLDCPFSETAFKSWSKFQNQVYEENYCHFSGEPSFGDTSMMKPILHKNWKKASEKIKATSFSM